MESSPSGEWVGTRGGETWLAEGTALGRRGLLPLLLAVGQHLGGLCFSAGFSQRRNRSEDGRECFLEKRGPITSLACAVLTVIAY